MILYSKEYKETNFLLKLSNYNRKGVCYDDNIKVSLNVENLIISEPPFQIFPPDVWSKMKFILCIPVLNSALITPIGSASSCKWLIGIPSMIYG